MRRKRVSESPERQRKTELITEAVEGRGLRPSTWTYNGPLISGGGTWEFNLDGQIAIVDGAGRAWKPLRFRNSEFDDLVRSIADDLLWAESIHRQLGAGNRARLASASYPYTQALGAYGDACEWLLRAEVQGHSEEQQRALTGAVATAEAKVRELYPAYVEAERALAEYNATCPQTEEEARAYLATLTIEDTRKRK